MPTPVIGATLIYAVSFMIIAGLQIIMSRMPDARKTFVVGVSLIAGISVFSLHDLYDKSPDWVNPIFNSALSLATVTAIILNLLLRIGNKKRLTLEVSVHQNFSQKVFDFMEHAGKYWGARQEVIMDATTALNEFLDIAAGSGITSDDHVKVAVTFDEINLDVMIFYKGKEIQFPDHRPTPAEILDSPDGHLKLAGFLVRKFAQKVSFTPGKEFNQVKLHFDH